MDHDHDHDHADTLAKALDHRTGPNQEHLFPNSEDQFMHLLAGGLVGKNQGEDNSGTYEGPNTIQPPQTKGLAQDLGQNVIAQMIVNPKLRGALLAAKIDSSLINHCGTIERHTLGLNIKNAPQLIQLMTDLANTHTDPKNRSAIRFREAAQLLAGNTISGRGLTNPQIEVLINFLKKRR